MTLRVFRIVIRIWIWNVLCRLTILNARFREGGAVLGGHRAFGRWRLAGRSRRSGLKIVALRSPMLGLLSLFPSPSWYEWSSHHVPSTSDGALLPCLSTMMNWMPLIKMPFFKALLSVSHSKTKWTNSVGMHFEKNNCVYMCIMRVVSACCWKGRFLKFIDKTIDKPSCKCLSIFRVFILFLSFDMFIWSHKSIHTLLKRLLNWLIRELFKYTSLDNKGSLSGTFINYYVINCWDNCS